MSNKNHHILYTNEFRSIVVIDIPASISLAQGYNSTLSSSNFDKRLISCPPVIQQYQTPEPKRKPGPSSRHSRLHANDDDDDDGETEEDPQRGNDERHRKATMPGKVCGNTVKDTKHAKYRELIIRALVEIRENYGGPLCGTRQLKDGKVWDGDSDGDGYKEIKDKEPRTVEYMATEEEKNKRKDQQAQMINAGEPLDVNTLLAQFCESEIITSMARFSYILGSSTLSEVKDTEDNGGSERKDYYQSDKYEMWGGFVHNSKGYTRILSIFDNHSKTCSANPINFYIPPHTTFLLNSCSDTASFHAAVRNVSNRPEYDHNNKRHFNLIILDPPWPNASAKRKCKSKRTGESYRTKSSLREIRNLLSGMDLDRLIAPNGLVAIWITNKPAVRALVLGPGGLFEQLNVSLVEEWVWVKVTCRGEPVTPLDGSWRKPYEVLLLARAPADQLKSVALERERELQGSASSERPVVKYKVLVAVPDLHSRKPCLKSLLEPMVSIDKSNEVNSSTEQKRKANACRALEIFARHLVAGWWSWGDQVLLNQWEGSWSS